MQAAWGWKISIDEWGADDGYRVCFYVGGGWVGHQVAFSAFTAQSDIMLMTNSFVSSALAHVSLMLREPMPMAIPTTAHELAHAQRRAACRHSLLPKSLSHTNTTARASMWAAFDTCRRVCGSMIRPGSGGRAPRTPSSCRAQRCQCRRQRARTLARWAAAHRRISSRSSTT